MKQPDYKLRISPVPCIHCRKYRAHAPQYISALSLFYNCKNVGNFKTTRQIAEGMHISFNLARGHIKNLLEHGLIKSALRGYDTGVYKKTGYGQATLAKWKNMGWVPKYK